MAVRSDETFMFDRAAETMARGDLAALQLRRLQQRSRAPMQVPHFRTRLDAPGVRRTISARRIARFRSRSKLICATITPSACSRAAGG
jgi:hypothetical protein